MSSLNLLFICSRNQWRSPTAEHLFRSDQYRTRSAGTEPSARVRVNEKHLAWAELIFVMEKRYRQRLQQQFPHLLDGKTVIVLDIPDEYGYMDEELVQLLRLSVGPYLEPEQE